MRAMCTVTTISAMILLMASATGCIAVAAAAGAGAGVAYATGDREEVLDGTPSEVASAAEAAFLELGMAVTRRADKEAESAVVARTARDKKVEVVATRRGDRSSSVSVRAGMWGDDALHDRVMAKIREHLAPPATPIQSTDEAAN